MQSLFSVEVLPGLSDGPRDWAGTSPGALLIFLVILYYPQTHVFEGLWHK